MAGNERGRPPGRDGLQTTTERDDSLGENRRRNGRNRRSGGFRWYGWAEALSRHPGLSERAKLAAWQLAALADNETGRVVIGHARLGERLGLPESPGDSYDGRQASRMRAARRVTRELREASALIVAQAGTGGRGRVDQANVYTLAEAALADVPALAETQDEPGRGSVETQDEAVRGLELNPGQLRPETQDGAVLLPTGSPTRPAIAHAHGGGGGDDEEKTRRVLDLLRPLGLVSETRLATLLSEHPEADAEQVARELVAAVNGGRVTVERSVLGLYGSWLRNAPAAPPPPPWPPSEVAPLVLRTPLTCAEMDEYLPVPGLVVSLAGGVLHVQGGSPESWSPAVDVLRRDGYNVQRIELHERPVSEDDKLLKARTEAAMQRMQA